MKNIPYWLREPLIYGTNDAPKDGQIVVIGSGISGASIAYFLLHDGWQVTMIDDEPEKSASFRNCGHILYGTVENFKALSALKGSENAKQIWQFSINACHQARETVAKHQLNVDYHQNGYLAIAISQAELTETIESIDLLRASGFSSEFYDSKKLHDLGFRNVYGGRYEKGSAQAHPVKFRNAMVRLFLKSGGTYLSHINVLDVKDHHGKALCQIKNRSQPVSFDAAVIATNAYSPLLSEFFRDHHLVEPFAGQIITSQPLSQPFAVTYPHSFNHGYEYALITPDQRLMIGGWRDQIQGMEKNTYDLQPLWEVTMGLRNFVDRHYQLPQTLTFPYQWKGIMASSKTGLPFIGPTNSPIIFTLAGFTGHGFSWAHGSAKILADMIMGKPVPSSIQFFRPNQLVKT